MSTMSINMYHIQHIEEQNQSANIIIHLRYVQEASVR